MRGGRIRGQGTYGCVFQPALLCRGTNGKAFDPNKVGKITSPEDARNELEIAKYLESLANSPMYTIAPESQGCVPKARSKQVDKDIELCEFSTNMKIEETVQLIMPWGGYPLSRINLDPRTFNFLKFTEDILAIGSFLLLNDMCHFDIWGQNFLFDNKNYPKLIDFGFTFRPSKLQQSDLRMRWRQIAVDHDTETPEVTLMLASQQGIPVSETVIGLQQQKPGVQRLAALCGVIPSEWAKGIRTWSQKSQSFQQKDWLTCWKVYWPGFDAWAIGVLLLQVLEIQMAIPEFQNSVMWKQKGSLIKNVIIGLCRSHPAERIDTAEALSMLTEGSHPLIAAGSVGNDWVKEKQSRRPVV
jgi:hypothetical protein